MKKVLFGLALLTSMTSFAPESSFEILKIRSTRIVLMELEASSFLRLG
jgi:hypothetical protein